MRLPLVLIVEDDLEARKLYAEMLQQAGLECAEAHNGFQAAEKAADLMPDAIVMDLGIPGIDGYELCRRLHADPRTSGIPIVAITGRYVSETDRRRALREGCQAVIVKPFRAEDLVAEINGALGVR